MRIPRPGIIFAASLALIAVAIGVRTWIVYSTQKQVMETFLQHARAGEFDACRALLADGSSMPQELELKDAAGRSLVSESSSIRDFFEGRRHFKTGGSPAGYSFTVINGRVKPRGGFMQYFPAGPEFKQKRGIAPSRGTIQ